MFASYTTCTIRGLTVPSCSVQAQQSRRRTHGVSNPGRYQSVTVHGGPHPPSKGIPVRKYASRTAAVLAVAASTTLLATAASASPLVEAADEIAPALAEQITEPLTLDADIAALADEGNDEAADLIASMLDVDEGTARELHTTLRGLLDVAETHDIVVLPSAPRAPEAPAGQSAP